MHAPVTASALLLSGAQKRLMHALSAYDAVSAHDPMGAVFLYSVADGVTERRLVTSGGDVFELLILR